MPRARIQRVMSRRVFYGDHYIATLSFSSSHGSAHDRVIADGIVTIINLHYSDVKQESWHLKSSFVMGNNKQSSKHHITSLLREESNGNIADSTCSSFRILFNY